MNKELEALHKIKIALTHDIEESDETFVSCEDEIKTIESALERKEKLEKTWEIVKEKKVNVRNFIKLKNWILDRGFEDFTYSLYTKYFSIYDCGSLLLTETEFNLLKEMLK